MKIRLLDSNIAHIYNYMGYDKCENFEWYRGEGYCDIAVFSDHHLHQSDLIKAKWKVAWLMEPPVINSSIYKTFKIFQKRYNFIINHNLAFLSQFPKEKCIFCPDAGSSLYSHEWKIYPKSKLVLTVVSKKGWTVGHKFRHEVVTVLGNKMDVIGRKYEYFPPEKRAETYAPYMYQVVIHNNCEEDYWSDILIDCFATGTIPIVWEGHYLKKYFNMDGIFVFDTIEQLNVILDLICAFDYQSRKKVIKENFDIAFTKYRLVEDHLYENLFKNLK